MYGNVRAVRTRMDQGRVTCALSALRCEDAHPPPHTSHLTLLVTSIHPGAQPLTDNKIVWPPLAVSEVVDEFASKAVQLRLFRQPAMPAFNTALERQHHALLC